MLKFMKKVPGGVLLIPMLVSALVNTFAPGFFAQFGGVTEVLFTTKGTSYVVGIACFCSAAMLDLKSLGMVLKKQGTLLITKVIICLALSTLFMKVFGFTGILGVSAIAFTVAICSVSPSMYLAMVSEYGEERDKGAFGLVGLVCVPAFPIFVFSITQGGSIDWMPILAAVIPIIAGLILGNLDRDFAKLVGGIMGPLTPFMGWSFGAGINLFEAIKAGPQGVLVTIIFYLALLPILLIVETKILKESGISAFGLSSVAGLSASIPSILAFSNPELTPYVSMATTQIAFGVVFTSVLTPIFTQFYAKKKGLAQPKAAKAAA